MPVLCKMGSWWIASSTAAPRRARRQTAHRGCGCPHSLRARVKRRPSSRCTDIPCRLPNPWSCSGTHMPRSSAPSSASACSSSSTRTRRRCPTACKNLVVYALQGRYEVDAIDTERRDHATELCREAAHEGYDVVVAFGGDGTVNEAANGLAGSPTPLTCLPGGATNVYCKMLGIPGDIVDATEHLLRLADDWRPRRGRPRHRQRPPLPVLRRHRPRRQRRRARRRPPARQDEPAPVVLHVRRDDDVHARVRRPPAAARDARRRRDAAGRQRVRAERRPVHVLRREAARGHRGRASSTTAPSAPRCSSAPRRWTSRPSPRACSPTA